MFLFAIGYGVGPQFVRGISQDGVPQALFSVVVCLFCLGTAYVGARFAGYNVGSAAGLHAGSTTISASMGLATDSIHRLGLAPEETKKLLDAMFIAVVGISSGPGFLAGRQQLGFSLLLWGVFVTTVPLIQAMDAGKYLFRFDEAILLGEWSR
jgi:uncharacterized transporter YbjL